MNVQCADDAVNRCKISVLRFNPQEPGSVPRMQTYELEEADGMTLFIALNEIREKQDPSLQFDFVCRAGICGSCGMMINGRPTLACRTLDQRLGPEISLAPLPVFELIADLSVNTGKWMRGMSERLRGLAAYEGAGCRPAPDRGKHGAGARGKDLRARPLHRVRLLRRRLRHRADARGLRRRGGAQQDRPLPARSARPAQR